MNRHLDEILRLIEEAQRQVEEAKIIRADYDGETEDLDDAELGLKWVKKKLQMMKSKTTT